MAHHLGTLYPSYDPRSWSENDKEVFEILIKLNRTSYDIIKQLYGSTYVPGRSLDIDLVKLLDTKYYTQIPYLNVEISAKIDKVNGRPMKVYPKKENKPDVIRNVGIKKGAPIVPLGDPRDRFTYDLGIKKPPTSIFIGRPHNKRR